MISTANSQQSSDCLNLQTIHPDSLYTDLKFLDNVLNNKAIIGVGESTHGTSEFTIMRHRLFRYLVENFGFNTFFLEADYSGCRNINRYIHNEYPYADSAL
ncbi:MAG: hypothetical protein C0594_09265, partial [Marinilabiliales bacterium]